MERGYDHKKLNKQFIKVVGNYRTEFARFKIPDNLEKWFNIILENDTETTTAKIINQKHRNNNSLDNQLETLGIGTKTNINGSLETTPNP